ncbi:MAG: tetratricopeptide repeat protein [Thermoanaerobacterium sp.]|nr:tetratricopeptide repeat protein [Thermoanaerobacterium sp.]
MGINSKNIFNKIYRINKAKKLLFNSIKYDPNSGRNYYCLAIWYMEMPKMLGGNLQKAIKCYKKANSLESEVYIKMGLAKALLKAGYFEEAKEILLEAVEDVPTKSNVDTRRKFEAIALLMRIDPKFKLEDRVMNECLPKSQNG